MLASRSRVLVQCWLAGHECWLIVTLLINITTCTGNYTGWKSILDHGRFSQRKWFCICRCYTTGCDWKFRHPVVWPSHKQLPLIWVVTYGKSNSKYTSNSNFFHFYSKGKINNSCDTSYGGSFTGCEQIGFLWSITQAPGQRKGLQLSKKDVTKPYNIQLNCFDGHLSPEEGFVNVLKKNNLQPIAISSLEKSCMGDGVKRIPVRERRLHGTLFLPPGNGPFPGQCKWSFCFQFYMGWKYFGPLPSFKAWSAKKILGHHLRKTCHSHRVPLFVWVC